MRTSQEWWSEVKRDPALFNEWLVKQYRGEVTAASRITDLTKKFSLSEKTSKILTTIAGQESQHAAWVLDLLKARGIEPDVEGAEERYWKAVMPAAVDFETTAAVGAHAESMRLERITAICQDEHAPEDVRSVFQRILKDELWHAEAFAKMAGKDAMEQTSYTHEQGRELLGLVH